MKKVLLIVLFFIPIIIYSQDFQYSYDKPCAKNNYTFEALNIINADSIVWSWEDGTPNSKLTNPPWQIIHRYTAPRFYNVSMKVYLNGNLTNITKIVEVYDVPNLNIEYPTPGVVCAGDDSIKVVITSNIIEYSDLEMTINWGDGITISGDYNTLNDTLRYTYKNTSCGNSISINNTVINDKYLIIVTAENICTSQNLPEMFFRAIDIKSKPNISLAIEDVVYDTILNTFYLCEPQTVKIKNPSYDEDNCLEVSSVEWFVFNNSNQIVDQCSTCDQDFDAAFPSYDNYRIELVQSNICGFDTVKSNILVKTPPQTFFLIPELIVCYPSKVDFQNLSSNSIVSCTWDFLGDSSEVAKVLGVRDTSYIYTEEGEYRVKLQTFDNYCFGYYDTLLILDHRCVDIYVPNAFLPNSINDDLKVFKPKAQNLLDYVIDIYNSNGEHLWHSVELNDGKPADGWNGTYRGTDCPAGTYIWQISATIDQGEFGSKIWDGQVYNYSSINEKRSKSGTFVLIR